MLRCRVHEGKPSKWRCATPTQRAAAACAAPRRSLPVLPLLIVIVVLFLLRTRLESWGLCMICP